MLKKIRMITFGLALAATTICTTASIKAAAVPTKEEFKKDMSWLAVAPDDKAGKELMQGVFGDLLYEYYYGPKKPMTSEQKKEEINVGFHTMIQHGEGQVQQPIEAVYNYAKAFNPNYREYRPMSNMNLDKYETGYGFDTIKVDASNKDIGTSMMYFNVKYPVSTVNTAVEAKLEYYQPEFLETMYNGLNKNIDVTNKDSMDKSIMNWFNKNVRTVLQYKVSREEYNKTYDNYLLEVRFDRLATATIVYNEANGIISIEMYYNNEPSVYNALKTQLATKGNVVKQNINAVKTLLSVSNNDTTNYIFNTMNNNCQRYWVTGIYKNEIVLPKEEVKVYEKLIPDRTKPNYETMDPDEVERMLEEQVREDNERINRENEERLEKERELEALMDAQVKEDNERINKENEERIQRERELEEALYASDLN